MTTIAYDGKYIVADGLETLGDLITSKSVDKIYKVGDGLFFALAGPVDEIESFVKEFKENTKAEFNESSVNGFMVQDGFVYYVGVSEGRYFRCKQGKEKFAVGSGSYFAIAAMDYGADALSAVHYAGKRSCKTGGDSFILDVQTGKQSVVECSDE